MRIEGRPEGPAFGGGEVDSRGDHRIAMSFTIASLRAAGPIAVRDTANVATSFPGFVGPGALGGPRCRPNRRVRDAAMTAVPVLTIDGPSGSGKGTVSRAVARALGWGLLDSGALYRLVALAGAAGGLDPGRCGGA